MKTHRRVTAFLAAGTLSLALVSTLGAQNPGYRVKIESSSVAQILEDFRSEDWATPFLRLASLRKSLTVDSLEWSRQRLDSLSAGLVDLILDGPNRSLSGSLVGVLQLNSGGRLVGSFGQLASIYEAHPPGVPRSFVVEKMGAFGEDPRATAFLEKLARAPNDKFEMDPDQLSALRALARTAPGRAKLRNLYEGGAVKNHHALIFLQELSTRGFRLEGRGGGSAGDLV